jgi:hypothetical protein
MPLVDTIFRYNRREQRGHYLTTLSDISIGKKKDLLATEKSPLAMEAGPLGSVQGPGKVELKAFRTEK